MEGSSRNYYVSDMLLCFEITKRQYQRRLVSKMEPNLALFDHLEKLEKGWTECLRELVKLSLGPKM